MTDMISRQAALDAIDDANDSLVEDDYTYGVQSGMEKAKYVIEALPSAQPRPMGRWNHGICSKCGGYAPFYPMASTYHESNFCPDCGADMRRVRWMN